jgi:hypothetical protein
MSPDQKLAEIERSLEQTPVAMVGDGVNDAAALAKSTCGIAVHGGAEASLAAADVYITTDSLHQIVSLTDGSSRVVSAVRACLMVSLSYNTVAASLALAGLMSPLLAAVLMPGRSSMVERQPSKLNVDGSSPFARFRQGIDSMGAMETRVRVPYSRLRQSEHAAGVAQLDRAPDYGSGG